MMKDLISIGIPTYNRPEGLRKTLFAIVNQSYRNIEIIISDNGSITGETEQIVNEFSKGDDRIKFFKQPENKGILFNFYFVLEKAKGDFFIWAADDDIWEGENFLELLANFAPDNILTFPETVVIGGNNVEMCRLRVYQNCNDQIDYIKALCSHGWGYPVYGLFNLKLFRDQDLKVEFSTEPYYAEYILLHKIYMAGNVKYVKEARLLSSTGGSRPHDIEAKGIRLSNFTTYLKRLLLLYKNSEFSEGVKKDIIKLILDSYIPYNRALYEDFISFEYPKGQAQTQQKPQQKPDNLNLGARIYKRVSLVAKVLVRGHY